MILSRRAHEEIVSLLQQQIAELRAERDFWRARCVPSTAQLSELPPVISLQPPDSRAPEVPPVDAGWTIDDRELFRDWVRDPENVRHGEDGLERWRERYGDSPPLYVLTV
jgi:hypothetical protein